MTLEDFVSNSIAQVMNGVCKAQQSIQDHDGKVNPKSLRMVKASSDAYYEEDSSRPAMVMEFDVSVITKEVDQTKGTAGIFVGAFKLGGEGSGANENHIANRLKFSVPIILPTQK